MHHRDYAVAQDGIWTVCRPTAVLRHRQLGRRPLRFCFDLFPLSFLKSWRRCYRLLLFPWSFKTFYLFLRGTKRVVEQYWRFTNNHRRTRAEERINSRNPIWTLASASFSHLTVFGHLSHSTAWHPRIMGVCIHSYVVIGNAGQLVPCPLAKTLPFLLVQVSSRVWMLVSHPLWPWSFFFYLYLVISVGAAGVTERNVSISNTSPEIVYTPFFCNSSEPSVISNSTQCNGGWWV